MKIEEKRLQIKMNNFIPTIHRLIFYIKATTESIKKIVEDVIQKIKTTTFQLPSGVEPIVISAGSRLD